MENLVRYSKKPGGEVDQWQSKIKQNLDDIAGGFEIKISIQS